MCQAVLGGAQPFPQHLPVPLSLSLLQLGVAAGTPAPSLMLGDSGSLPDAQHLGCWGQGRVFAMVRPLFRITKKSHRHISYNPGAAAAHGKANEHLLVGKRIRAGLGF